MLQQIYNRKLALSKSNSKDSIIVQQPLVLNDYLRKSLSSSQSPDNRVSILMRKAMINKLKDAINFMDEQIS